MAMKKIEVVADKIRFDRKNHVKGTRLMMEDVIADSFVEQKKVKIIAPPKKKDPKK